MFSPEISTQVKESEIDLIGTKSVSKENDIEYLGTKGNDVQEFTSVSENSIDKARLKILYCSLKKRTEV